MLHTATSLYLGVLCYNSNPKGMLRTEQLRYDNLENDDTRRLVLARFPITGIRVYFGRTRWGRNMTPLTTEEGSNVDANWDKHRDVKFQIAEVGWRAELPLPSRVCG